LYHSYFDHEKRKKTICYRTPFRILNCYTDPMTVRIKVRHRSSTIDSPKFVEWKYVLGKGDYLALPDLIYRLDFFVAFEPSHKHLKSGFELINKAFEEDLMLYDEVKPEEQSNEDNFMSAQYLMQLHSKRSEFRRDKNSKILAKLFS
jgi:hypothetical protein